MLVRMSENNLFDREGLSNEDTPELVAQFYHADLAREAGVLMSSARDDSVDRCAEEDAGAA